MRHILLLLGLVACGGGDDPPTRSDIDAAVEEMRGACNNPPPPQSPPPTGVESIGYQVGLELGTKVCLEFVHQLEHCIDTADEPIACFAPPSTSLRD